MSIVARLDGVSLAYGPDVVVRDLDLAAESGSIVAVVGGDGAGKTTTLRTLAGRRSPRTGTATLPDRHEIGVVPAVGATWGDLTVEENLAFAGQAHGAPPDVRAALLERMDLAGARRRLARDLSGGMRQKLALAMAVQHRPRLLVLDEPTTGVDPVSRTEIWRLLGEEVSRDTAVVLATTYLDEAERATRVVLLDAGRVLATGTPAEVMASTPGVVVRAGVRLGPRSWRRGPRWHTWLDERDDVPTDAEVVQPDLEDAAIVRALARELRA